MEKVFLISGLGADYRLFKYLSLPGYEIIHAHYFEPLPRETLSAYADRIIVRYGIDNNDNVIGVSLGGMLTVEIVGKLKLNKAIIISSMKSRAEAPSYHRFFRAFPIYKLIPGRLVASSGALFKPFFFKQMGGESHLFSLMLKNSSPRFLKWAMDAVLAWDPQPADQPIYHIIGDADLVFNYKRSKDATVVKGGDHMMVFTKGTEINSLIKTILTRQLEPASIDSI